MPPSPVGATAIGLNFYPKSRRLHRARIGGPHASRHPAPARGSVRQRTRAANRGDPPALPRSTWRNCTATKRPPSLSRRHRRLRRPRRLRRLRFFAIGRFAPPKPCCSTAPQPPTLRRPPGSPSIGTLARGGPPSASSSPAGLGLPSNVAPRYRTPPNPGASILCSRIESSPGKDKIT